MDKITEQDLANRGVKGLPDVPGLTTEEMQRKLEEIAREILIPKVNELVEGLNNANSNLQKCHINGDTAYEILYFRWSGIVTAGQTVSLGSYESNVPRGKRFVSMFLTPIANQHISMSYIDGYVYAYSESYSGAFNYDVLMVVS